MRVDSARSFERLTRLSYSGGQTTVAEQLPGKPNIVQAIKSTFLGFLALRIRPLGPLFSLKIGSKRLSWGFGSDWDVLEKSLALQRIDEGSLIDLLGKKWIVVSASHNAKEQLKATTHIDRFFSNHISNM